MLQWLQHIPCIILFLSDETILILVRNSHISLFESCFFHSINFSIKILHICPVIARRLLTTFKLLLSDAINIAFFSNRIIFSAAYSIVSWPNRPYYTFMNINPYRCSEIKLIFSRPPPTISSIRLIFCIESIQISFPRYLIDSTNVS